MDKREEKQRTDPYGILSYAIGSEDDFVCFDWYLGDRAVLLHAVVNSETGHFIQDFDKRIVRRSEALEAFRDMVEEAVGWCIENDVTIDTEGWCVDERGDSIVQAFRKALKEE